MSGKYRLTGRLEGSELAEWFRAVRLPADPVVVKLFHARTSDSGYARELRELNRPLASAGHPGVLRPLELGMAKDRLAVVRPDVGGFSLGQVMQRLSSRDVYLQPNVALRLIQELVAVIDSAHQAGAIHGALTPGNALVSPEGRPAVCDFGVLRALNGVPHLRRSFGASGRRAYRAPELLKGEPPTAVSDVYSLGALAYELLTLHEPDTGKAIMSVRRDGLLPPSRFDRRLHVKVDAWVMRALDASQGRRFPSCRAMYDALEELFDGVLDIPEPQEARRFLSEMFPNEVRFSEPQGALPFEDPFVLAEAHTPSTGEHERLEELPARPRFSRELPVIDDPLSTEVQLPAVEAPASWHAPPSDGTVEYTIRPAQVGEAALKRLRPIGDFDENATIENPYPPLHVDARAPSKRSAWAYAAEPAPDAGPLPMTGLSQVHGGPSRNFRLHALWLVLAVALGGATILALSLTFRSSEPPSRGPRPQRVVRRSEAPKSAAPVQRSTPPPVTEAPPPAPRPVPAPKIAETVVDWHEPPKRSAGFLSVSADVPAVFYVDGQRVRRPLPLNRYPVAPGQRKLAIVEARTGERREFQLRVAKGQHLKVLEKFTKR